MNNPKFTIEHALEELQNGNNTNAINMLRTLTNSSPNDAEVWSFLGIALISSDKNNAIEALKKACSLAPSEPRWHLHLGTCLHQVQEYIDAEHALGRAVQLSAYAPDSALPYAKTLIRLGRIQEALDALRQTISRYHSPAAHYQIAQISAMKHDYNGAIRSIRAAYKGIVMPAKSLLMLAQWQIYVKQYAAAQQDLERILSSEPFHPQSSILLANLATWQGEIERAKAILLKAYTQHPEHTGLLIEQLMLSSKDESKIYQSAAAVLKQNTISREERKKLLFALAQFADRSGDFDLAWDYATQANGLARSDNVFDVSLLDKQLDVAVRMFQKTPPITTESTIQSIYFLGPPRCGGSLLQTVLAAAPNAVSVGERGALLPYLMPLVNDKNGSAEFSRQQQDLHNADISGLLELEPTARLFIDKTTHNTHVAGLLHRIHPSARFVNLIRDKKDMALSIYMRDFSETFNYSHTLEDINAYLDFQTRAVETWKDLGVPIITHNHDSFVLAPEQYGRQLFDGLAIPWNEQYLSTQARQSSVETFSALQVRSEITSPPRPKWQSYAKHLSRFD